MVKVEAELEPRGIWLGWSSEVLDGGELAVALRARRERGGNGELREGATAWRGVKAQRSCSGARGSTTRPASLVYGHHTAAAA
jgi:hypothetical protein